MYKTKIINKKTFFYILISLSIVYLTLLLILYHVRVVTFPFQLEYRESVPLLITDALCKGILPYNTNQLPYYSDLYGVVHPLITLPFTILLGNNLVTFKIVSLICIFFTCMLLFLNLKKNSKSVLSSIILTLLFYALSLFQYTPICRSDALGLLFFSISIIYPFQNDFSIKSLICASFFSVLAFHTKIYFFIGFPIILSYLFLFVSISKALKSGMIYGLIFGITFLINSSLFDYYYIGTFHNQLASSSYEFAHMVKQTSYYFFSTLPVLTLFLVYITIRYFILNKDKYLNFFTITPHKINLTKHFNFKNGNSGVFADNFISYWTYLFVCLLFILTFKMGGHNGNFLLYYIHLLSIPLIFLMNSFFNKYETIHKLIMGLVVLNILIVVKILPIKINEIESVIKYKKIESIVKHSNMVLSNPIIGSIAFKEHKKVLNSGLTETFIIGDQFRYSGKIPKPLAMIKDKIYLKTINKVKPINKKYLENINYKIKTHAFDVIFTDTSIYDNWLITSKELNKNGYIPIDTFDINMFASYQNWRLICWRKSRKK
jgi:hypothetical protein